MGASMSAPYETTGLCAVDSSALTLTTPSAPSATCSLVHANPAPAGVQCGVTGYLSRPSLLTTYTPHQHHSDPNLTPEMECATSCFTLPTCASFSYDPSTLTCDLFSLQLSAQKLHKARPGQGAIFSDSDCYLQECGISTPLALSSSSHLKAQKTHDFCSSDIRVQLTDPAKHYDESTYFPIHLPFPLHILGASSKTAYMSINGYISLSSPMLSPAESHALPWWTHLAPSEEEWGQPQVVPGLPENTVGVLWTEQRVLASSNPSGYVGGGSQQRMATQQVGQQGLSYTITGAQGSRKVEFSWRTSHAADKQNILHYSASYAEDTQGVWEMRYHGFSDADVGSYAVVGVQGSEVEGRWGSLETSEGGVLGMGSVIQFSGEDARFTKKRREVRDRSEMERQILHHGREEES